MDRCKDTIIFSVTEHCPTSFFVPNTFSPNNDLRNQVFKPVISGTFKSYSMTILNRWGKIIYSNNSNGEWDGTYMGKPVFDGVYVVIININTQSETNSILWHPNPDSLKRLFFRLDRPKGNNLRITFVTLLKAPDYTKVLLPNGITLVHKQIKATRLVHCGYIINAGSRNDEPLKGMAHALEHMVFKGTKKRKTWQIISYLENVGGELNAYTTRDYTAIYTSLHKKFFSRALDLLSDIVFHSTIPNPELQKEKSNS